MFSCPCVGESRVEKRLSSCLCCSRVAVLHFIICFQLSLYYLTAAFFPHTHFNRRMSENDDIEVDSDADKRAHHNALERKRRDHIKDSFHSLRDSVPSLQGEKASRAQILDKATEYIQFMRRKNHSHQQDIDDLKKQNALLEQQGLKGCLMNADQEDVIQPAHYLWVLHDVKLAPQPPHTPQTTQQIQVGSDTGGCTASGINKYNNT
uniref:Protein max n=1 Tax=Monopterus albus TaxID=43700 RepID=A0A3Q3JSQ8_MONAL